MPRDRSKKDDSYYHKGYECNKKKGICACAYTQGGGKLDKRKEFVCRARYIDDKHNQFCAMVSIKKTSRKLIRLVAQQFTLPTKENRLCIGSHHFPSPLLCSENKGPILSITERERSELMSKHDEKITILVKK